MRSALEQLLFPAECLLCRALLPAPQAAQLVCPVCRHRWRRVVPPWCERCGQPGPRFGPCRLCAAWPRTLTRVRSAVWLDAAARPAVHALKYRGFPRIADELAEVMARALPAPGGPAVLVPIPLAPGRLRARGYNQSERLAAALGRHWGVPTAARFLTRVKETPSQTALTPALREANVAGVFGVLSGGLGERAPGPRPGVDPPGPCFVLVDDVFTTGATLAEAARTLERAGAGAVTAVTFGRAVIPDFS